MESDKNLRHLFEDAGDIVAYQLVEEKALLTAIGCRGADYVDLRKRIPKPTDLSEPGLLLPGNRSYQTLYELMPFTSGRKDLENAQLSKVTRRPQVRTDV